MSENSLLAKLMEEKRERSELRLFKLLDDIVYCESEVFGDSYHLQFDDLSVPYQRAIVAKFIEVDDRDLFSIYENENIDLITDNLISLLNLNDKESRDVFVNNLLDNLVDYYKDRAQKLIDERCEYVAEARGVHYEE